jgi:hypothetical protein
VTIVLRPEARADLEDARSWYEAQRSGLGGEFLQQVDYQKIYNALNNVADNLQADEVRMTVGIALAAFIFAYGLGTVIGARTTRGVPRLLSRFRQDWGAKRFPKWYKKNIRRVLGDNLYKAARESVEEDLRVQGRLRD